jgi:hypothetical protein
MAPVRSLKPWPLNGSSSILTATTSHLRFARAILRKKSEHRKVLSFRAPDERPLNSVSRRRQCMAYLYVDDADALHAEWSSIEGRHHRPEDTPYGLREGAFVDPDGNLLRYGSPV